MMRVIEITFSPTGGTKRAADMLTAAWAQSADTVDLTCPETDFSAVPFSAQDAAVIAMPSFGGRAPAVAVQRLRQLKGNGARCVLLCVYGNRAYEDTLVEMEDAAKDAGFQVTAAVAAVAEHSILRQYAAGRPDQADERTLKEFGGKIAQKLAQDDPIAPTIPGNRPYKKAGGAGLVPKAGSTCTACGTCAGKCPVGAIPKAAPKTTDAKKCISCMRCIAVCPAGARKTNQALTATASLALKKACSQRKECELYL